MTTPTTTVASTTTTPRTVEINDEPLTAGRGLPLNLLLSTAGDLIRFEGQTIPGVAVVVATKYVKNGKWSHDQWTVRLADGWHHVRYARAQGAEFFPCASAEEQAQALTLSEWTGSGYIKRQPTAAAVQALVDKHYPRVAARWAQVAADVAALAAVAPPAPAAPPAPSLADRLAAAEAEIKALRAALKEAQDAAARPATAPCVPADVTGAQRYDRVRLCRPAIKRAQAAADKADLGELLAAATAIINAVQGR